MKTLLSLCSAVALLLCPAIASMALHPLLAFLGTLTCLALAVASFKLARSSTD